MMTIQDFNREVLEWAEEIGVKPKEIKIKPLKTKWGYCSYDGIVTFSYDVLNQKDEFRYYIIIHELLHLKYRKHGRLMDALIMYYLAKRNIPYKEFIIAD